MKRRKTSQLEVALSDGFDPDELFFNAVRIRNAREVRKLLKSGADINHTDWDGSTALHVDAGFEGTEVTKVLLDAGVMMHSKDEDGLTALAIVLERDDRAKARFLIAHGAKDANMPATITIDRQGMVTEERSQDVMASLMESAVIPVKEREL